LGDPLLVGRIEIIFSIKQMVSCATMQLIVKNELGATMRATYLMRCFACVRVHKILATP